MALKTPEEWQAERQRLSADYAAKAAGFTPAPVTQVAGTGPAELQQVLAQRQSALQGYQAPELAGMRAAMAQQQQAGQNQESRALQAALAKQGIRGGAAASLQAQMAQKAAMQQGQQETQLMMAQEQRQREALGEYDKTVNEAYQKAQEQAFQEAAAKLAMEQLAQADYLAQMGKESQDLYSTEMADATKEAGGCFSILIISTAGLALGVSDAKASEIIGAAKTAPEARSVVVSCDSEGKVWDEITALRALRDSEATVEQKRGYYRFSEAVAPVVSQSKLFQKLGYVCMIRPAVKYATGQRGISGLMTKAWLKIFEVLGANGPFERKNGEIV